MPKVQGYWAGCRGGFRSYDEPPRRGEWSTEHGCHDLDLLGHVAVVTRIESGLKPGANRFQRSIVQLLCVMRPAQALA